MTVVVGHSRTTCSASQPQVSRNVAGTYDYGYIATGPNTDLTPGAIIFRRDVSSNAVQTFDLATITGNPFNLPMGNDNHFTFAVMSDVDENVWVIGNSHAQPFNFGRTTWPPNTSSSWTFPSFASMPYSSIGADIHTYSQFMRATDGTMYCCMEQEEAAGYEKRFWSFMKLPPHSTTWSFVDPSFPILLTGNHPAASDEPDRCYANLMLVGTRMHMIGLFARVDETTSLWWRRGHSYIWSDPPYTTWKTIDGTVITLPLQWSNKTPALVSSAPTYSESGGQSFCIDSSGFPHVNWANTQVDGQPGTPTYYECYWNGSAWTSRSVIAPGSSVGPGIIAYGGSTWSVCSAIGRMRLRETVTGNTLYVGALAPNGVMAVPDPIGVRDKNRITYICADGDTPVVYDIGCRGWKPGP